MNETAAERQNGLTRRLTEAARAYYQEDREIMSDREYDAMCEELARLENETGTVLAGSPTLKVGHEIVSSLNKVAHETPMLSLNKTKNAGDLAVFLNGRDGVLSWKLDGLTVALRYAGGELRQAVTRGDGETGEDVTHNAKFFTNIPLRLKHQGELVVRGEAVIAFEDFVKINESLPPEERYKNPRNLCSGTVRQLDSRQSAGRRVRFFLFSVEKADGADFYNSRARSLEWAERAGFETAGREVVNALNIAEKITEYEKKVGNNIFATDGLVLAYDDIEYGASLGRTAKFKRDSIAFKWRDTERETRLTAIEWSTSRTGLINPVAVFEPTELEGTTVSRASLHNLSVVEGLELGVGDAILVYKANMIIPQISENLTRSGAAGYPENCPACGRAVSLSDSGGVRYIYCANAGCGAQLLRSFAHFVSRGAMNVEGLSEATLEKFIEKGFVKNYTDIYRLENFKDEIINLDGFGEKSCAKILASVEKSRDARLASFVYGLGITHVGLATAKLLCARYGDDIEEIMAAPAEELAGIENFGGIIANSVADYFSDEANRAAVREAAGLLRFIARPGAEAEENVKKLAGKTVVVTGDLINFKNREELAAAIENAGGKVASAVSSKTDFLINNDILSRSGKNKKARELGVEIIGEAEFVKKYL